MMSENVRYTREWDLQMIQTKREIPKAFLLAMGPSFPISLFLSDASSRKSIWHSAHPRADHWQRLATASSGSDTC
jgi:hypothetical protein